MNDKLTALKEKGIFLYLETKKINSAGLVFLDWLNHSEGGLVFEELTNCLAEIFIQKVALNEILPEEYQPKIKALFEEMKPTVTRISEMTSDYQNIQIPWLSNSKQYHLGLKIKIEDFVNDQPKLFQENLESRLLYYCIEDTAKQICQENICHSLDDFISNPHLNKTIVDMFMGHLNTPK